MSAAQHDGPAANDRTEGQTGNEYHAEENTPLLAPEDCASTAHPDRSGAERSEDATLNEQSIVEDNDNKPLPKSQIFFLCYARLIEPIAFFCVFPYINQMAQENGNLEDSDVGFYSGIIESLFSLTQMIVMIIWGKAADRLGRKPVLVFSLVGVTLATAVFGLAKTIPQMILFRCLAGVFAGTIVTIRTMIAEHSTPKTQARAFSWFAFTGNMGIMIGPVVGGALADPVHQYPKLFGNIPFFTDYPYALPSFAIACISLSAVVITVLFVEETLQKETFGDGSGESATPKAASLSTWELVKSPGIGITLYAYGHVMLLAFSYTAILPVFWYTPAPLGGYGLTPFQISLLMLVNGMAQAIWVLIVFPPLQHRIGTTGVLRVCAVAYPVAFSVCPVFNVLLRNDGQTAFWVVAPAAQAIASGISMSFTAVQLAVNGVSPTPQVLGTLNALALTVTSGIRAFSPALFTSLFAVGARTQWLWGYAIWVVMIAIAGIWTMVSRHLPDYGVLESKRKQGQSLSRGVVEE